MSGPEHSPSHPFPSGEHRASATLPPELADFLEDKQYACVTQATDHGTVFVVKAPALDIESVRGRVPIQLRHALYEHPAAPVIRTVTTIYDQPERPLALETFINVADEQQRADVATLSRQRELHLLFYDEHLSHRLSKAVRLRDQETLGRIVQQAERLAAAIPDERFDFDSAKQAVMEATRL